MCCIAGIYITPLLYSRVLYNTLYYDNDIQHLLFSTYPFLYSMLYITAIIWKPDLLHNFWDVGISLVYLFRKIYSRDIPRISPTQCSGLGYPWNIPNWKL